jgi:hypothetical protein
MINPLLWTTYVASAALGPAAIAGLTASVIFTAREDNNTPAPENTLKFGMLIGLLSTPFLRHYGEVSRDLENCLMKEPKVKNNPSTGKLGVIPYSQARREALEAAVPVWFYFSFPCLACAISTPNDKHRVVLSMLGTSFAGLAAACRLQNTPVVPNEYDSQEFQTREEKPLKPMLYFNKVDSDGPRLDEYSAEVKRILENKKKQKNALGSKFFSWFKNGVQKKQPEHGNARVLLVGMK